MNSLGPCSECGEPTPSLDLNFECWLCPPCRALWWQDYERHEMDATSRRAPFDIEEVEAW